ncbi:phosphomannomutase/phosphoglucomutase [Ectothiorhodospiraceae bacterium 2226]|nr:phosphomannomutase/phosphoglucomutase [Ectothiorhodospiraceae bacterium 2226]
MGLPEDDLPPGIFRAYDIRGIVGSELSEATFERLGRAVAEEARSRGVVRLVLGRDGRLSSAALAEALARGAAGAGVEVLDAGQVPTPVLYFAAHAYADGSGMMVTGSHNPPEYNGLKVMLQGVTLAEDAIQGLRARALAADLAAESAASAPPAASPDVRLGCTPIPDYIARVCADVQLARPLRVVLDCGHGAGAWVAPDLLRALGCEVYPLNCTVDGRFPGHAPDPSQPENLRELVAAVTARRADLGLALDGDADRLNVVDSAGKIRWPDHQLLVLARDILARHPGGQVIYDVKSSGDIAPAVRGWGGRALMWRSGHSLLKAKLQETGAVLAGELSGHLFLADRWYGFDDALYAAARLLEIVSRAPTPLAAFEWLPQRAATPELRVPLPEGQGRAWMARLVLAPPPSEGDLTTLDGVRVDYAEGFALLRASNTLPCLTLRFEGRDAAALARVQQQFKAWVAPVLPTLAWPVLTEEDEAL